MATLIFRKALCYGITPIFCYRFQPASLASLLFINFQFRFNLVVGSWLSPWTYVLRHHKKKLCYGIGALIP